jgi:hypothetical protein
VTPEAGLFLDKARQSLAIADYMVGEWPAEAGRSAYLAAFHAAQALIAERTGRAAVKTHKGVNASFQRLTMGDIGSTGTYAVFSAGATISKSAPIMAPGRTRWFQTVPRMRRWQPRSDLLLAARRRYWRQLAAPNRPGRDRRLVRNRVL